MRIRFKEDTNIRQTPDTSHPPLGIAFAGTELTVDLATPAGQWFRDPNGWYYWAGGTEIVAEMLPPVDTTGEQPIPPIPDRPPLPPDLAFPMALTEEEEPDSTDIPEGETRSVTASRGAVPVSIPEMPPSLPPEDPGTRGRGAVLVAVPEPPPVMPPVFESQTTVMVVEKTDPLLKIDAAKLGWGTARYSIETEWWKNRQLTGRGVTIALLSTGVLPGHPDLQEAIRDQANFVFAQGDIAADLDGVGTQAAVIAAGRGYLTYGVAPEAELLVGLVGQYDRDITSARLLEGLRWAIANDADIVALLVDLRDLTPEDKMEWQATIEEAVNRDIILLAPVGNSLERRPEVRYPANMEGVISIGAHDQSGLRSAFSAKSYRLDVLAPGEGLLTSDLRGQSVVNLKSTAIATAYAAGMLALVRQWEAAHGRVRPPAAIRELLRSTATPHKSITQGNDVEYGYGILNPPALLRQLENH